MPRLYECRQGNCIRADALLDNYAYVGGNPDTLTDPSSHFPDPGDGDIGPEDVLRLIVFL